MAIMTRCSTTSLLTRVCLAAFVSGALAPSPAQATPAFARQFNAKCSMCHAPLPPRLNNLGLTFKRLGYRLPDTNEDGRLVLQDKPSRSLGDNFALIGDFRVEGARGQPTPLSMHEFELVGAGTAGAHLSFAAEVAWEEGEFEMEGYEGQLLLGRPDMNLTARVGLVNPLLWDKWGHQRLGVARAHLLNRRVPVGEFAGFRPRDMQEGVELGLNLIRVGETGGALRTTFLSVGVYNGLSPAGPELGERDDAKDVMVQAVQLWGESHTVGAFWYRGSVTDIGDPAFDDRYHRWALFGNYEMRPGTDVLAGYMGGRDSTTDQTLRRVSSRSWFLELDQTLVPGAVAFVRYDRFEPRKSVDSVRRSGPTVGIAGQPFDHLLLTAEYTGQRVGSGTRSRDIVLRLILIY